MNFSVAVLTAITPQNKAFSLDSTGKLIKKSSVNPYAGSFQTVAIDSLEHFADSITKLPNNQSLILGTIKDTTGKTLTAGDSIGLATKGKEDATHISKTLDYISYDFDAF